MICLNLLTIALLQPQDMISSHKRLTVSRQQFIDLFIKKKFYDSNANASKLNGSSGFERLRTLI